VLNLLQPYLKMSHKLYRKETNCLNCGAEVTGKFCPNCGQENLETKENFFHLAGHFIADYFHYDSKFFRSFIPLFTKPGFLTREYWDGRRVHYIHPLRLFFFITILFIIVTTYFYSRFGAEMKTRLIERDKAAVQLDTNRFATMKPADKIFFKGDSVTLQSMRAQLKGEERRIGKIMVGIDHVFVNLKYVMFILLPLYAVVFKILYRKQRLYYVDHLVYAMHLQCFSYVLLALLLMLPIVSPISISSIRQIAFFVILVYVMISVHNLYHQKLWKTLVKSLLATSTIFFMTILSILIVAAIDAIFLQ
jgi:hypothetical protein